jgi:hypothetical protein
MLIAPQVRHVNSAVGATYCRKPNLCTCCNIYDAMYRTRPYRQWPIIGLLGLEDSLTRVPIECPTAPC